MFMYYLYYVMLFMLINTSKYEYKLSTTLYYLLKNRTKIKLSTKVFEKTGLLRL